MNFDGLRESDRRQDDHYYVEGKMKLEIWAQASVCQIVLDLGPPENINISRKKFQKYVNLQSIYKICYLLIQQVQSGKFKLII